MIRRSILTQARLTLLLMMLLLAAVPTAYGQDAGTQDAATQERLDRIERDLSMLQRQVYRDGGDEAPTTGPGGNIAVGLQVRIDRLEQQMRDLTGRVEDMTNDVAQLRQRLEQVNSDIDVRLGQGGGPPAAPPVPALAAGEPATTDAAPAYPRQRPPEDRPAPDQSANFGTLTPPGSQPVTQPGPSPDRLYPGSAGSIGQTASAGSLRPPGNETLPSASPSSQYNAAFGLLRRADYPAAEDALRNFIQQYPTNPLAGNAQYWLGESFYVRGRYADAAAAFAEGYKRYPRGPKAADGLLKLGMSLARANQKHNACIALIQLDHQFPHPGSAIKDRSAQEKKTARVLNSPAAAEPLGLAEFAAALDRLAAFESAPLVAVGVSGGADSLALAILADRWARARGGEICALSIDHRLRAESGAEMRRLAGWLAALAIRHEILVWDEKKPATRVQEAARAARYRLLAGWCREHGCLHLLTAHHRDDQAETHLIRREAGSGADGLAGMSAVRELDCCRLLRPLLGIPKVRLIATLDREGQPFIADPSNRDPTFARGRLRAGATAVSADDLEAALDAVGRLGSERIARQRARDDLLARAVSLHPAGFALLDCAPLLAAPAELAEQALGAMVTVLGGGSYPPRRRRVARLLRVLAGDAPGGNTLGGCRFVAWRGRRLVLRELAAAAGPVRVAPGASLIWDRRFHVVLPAAAGSALTIDYLGAVGVAELGRRRRRQPPTGVPLLAHAILPALRDETGLLAVPDLGYRRGGATLLPTVVFRPVQSLSEAGFAVV